MRNPRATLPPCDHDECGTLECRHAGGSERLLVRRWRVTCVREIPRGNRGQLFGPNRDIFALPPAVRIERVWEFDADSETEIHRHFREAKMMLEPQVKGMRIKSIVEILPNRESSEPTP